MLDMCLREGAFKQLYSYTLDSPFDKTEFVLEIVVICIGILRRNAAEIDVVVVEGDG